jgi:hypothetical protein
VGQFSSGNVFWEFKDSGSYADGGPEWEDWDGDSFGVNEEIKCISGWTASPANPYGITYFGHPTWDRWGRHVVFVAYTDCPACPGLKIYDRSTRTVAAHWVLQYQVYSGQHHSWAGFTDFVIDIANSNRHIWANKYTESYDGANVIQIADPHCVASPGNYNAFPRPSQSPDGTKVAFAQYFLNSDDYPYIAYAVVYYPHPPKITGATKSGANVRLAWDWDNDSKYTTRGWPDEGVDDPPEPREIKYYHVWTSEDNTTWTELTTTGVVFATKLYDVAQSNSSTRYYAVTSEEHSRLESHILSNTWKVTLDAEGAITTSAEESAYPANPGGSDPFWTTEPLAPGSFTAEATETPGHYQLSWSEPSNSKIRYYNIYSSTTETPPADQQHRIASVPIGTSSWLDWCADPESTPYYKITSVDRYGNEGATVGSKIRGTFTISGGTMQ